MSHQLAADLVREPLYSSLPLICLHSPSTQCSLILPYSGSHKQPSLILAIHMTSFAKLFPSSITSASLPREPVLELSGQPRWYGTSVADYPMESIQSSNTPKEPGLEESLSSPLFATLLLALHQDGTCKQFNLNIVCGYECHYESGKSRNCIQASPPTWQSTQHCS